MTASQPTHCRPTLLRYLAVIVYDTLLLFSVLLLASAIVVLINQGQAVEQGSLLFTLYLLIMSFVFYGWFWTHGGQTLGMRSWKVKLHRNDHHAITWRQALLRFVTAIISWLAVGLGFSWLYLSNTQQSWHDIASSTYLHYDKDQIAKPLSRLSD